MAKNNVSEVWIAAQNRGHPSYFTWATSGKRVNTANWCPGQPDNNGGMEYCVKFVGNCWDDVNCDLKIPFYCNLPRTARPKKYEGVCKKKEDGVSMECDLMG